MLIAVAASLVILGIVLRRPLLSVVGLFLLAGVAAAVAKPVFVAAHFRRLPR